MAMVEEMAGAASIMGIILVDVLFFMRIATEDGQGWVRSTLWFRVFSMFLVHILVMYCRLVKCE